MKTLKFFSLVLLVEQTSLYELQKSVWLYLCSMTWGQKAQYMIWIVGQLCVSLQPPITGLEAFESYMANMSTMAKFARSFLFFFSRSLCFRIVPVMQKRLLLKQVLEESNRDQKGGYSSSKTGCKLDAELGCKVAVTEINCKYYI